MSLNLEGSEPDGYRVVKHIANGAYTEVYLAVAPDGRDVVLKALNPRLNKGSRITDEQLLWHFTNEVEAMRKVRHSYVVELLKAGRSRSLAGVEFNYLITEYMYGGTLKDYCRGASLTLQQTLDLFGPVCDALTYVHRNGIIHCDIKPSNLLLDRAENPTLIKLADFSVSKVMAGGAAQDRIPVGTSPYAAPEHHPEATDAERAQPLDARADVYALAMTILHALTGARPEFDRRQIANLAPHPAYQEFKHELERVLGRATAISVERRYPSVEAFWRELHSLGIAIDSDRTVTRTTRRMVFSVGAARADEAHIVERLALPEGLLMEVVQIPQGSFQRGTAPEEIERWTALLPEYMQRQARTWLGWETPVRPVTVESFWMGKYPVTQKQWRVVSTNLPQESYYLPGSPWESRKAPVARDDERPVTNVTWLEAYEFCARLSVYTGRDIRLPSEAEWEYACRGGTTTPFNFPSHEALDEEMLNYNGSVPDALGTHRWRTERGPSIVGQVGVPNPFGLFDMHGNVWEWCTDAWRETYKGLSTDGTPVRGPNELLRVARGGSWSSFAFMCRSASRARFLYNEYFDDIGLRIAV
ncbi:MAG: SUMF1/EgtB/PvdO family nonheme iron enzyme [Pyrinomonadaceae bacterium]